MAKLETQVTLINCAHCRGRSAGFTYMQCKECNCRNYAKPRMKSVMNIIVQTWFWYYLYKLIFGNFLTVALLSFLLHFFLGRLDYIT